MLCFHIGADIVVNETFVLEPQDNRVPVPIVIIDDALPEYEDYFHFGIVRSPNDYGLQQQYFTLTVVDNDGKNFVIERLNTCTKSIMTNDMLGQRTINVSFFTYPCYSSYWY